MTLHDKIEAAREALTAYLKDDDCYCEEMGAFNKTPCTVHAGRHALSTLPAKPMTEDEIAKIILRQLLTGGSDYDIMRALRDAGALYVEEKK